MEGKSNEPNTAELETEMQYHEEIGKALKKDIRTGSKESNYQRGTRVLAYNSKIHRVVRAEIQKGESGIYVLQYKAEDGSYKSFVGTEKRIQLID